MKRIIKNNLLGFIVGAIIFGTVGVIAANYAANEISFTTSKNSNVKTVKDALDDLYNIKDINVSELQTFSNSAYTSTKSTTNTVSLSNLNKGEYICYSYYAASSYETISGNGDTTSVAYEIDGCSQKNVFNNHGHWNSASTVVTGDVHTSVMSRGASFYCKIDSNESTIDVKYKPTSAGSACSVSMQISCTKVK